MPGWLKTAYGWAVGNAVDVWNKTLGLIGTLYSYVSSAISGIDAEISNIYTGLVSFIKSVENWASSTIARVTVWVKSLIDNLTNYVVSLANHAIDYINQVYKWAAGAVNDLRNAIRNAIASVATWVIKNIYTPIAGAIQTLANWVTRYGYVAYTLATHPEMLSRLLAKYIWQESLSLADHYAAPIASWLLRGMLKMANPVGKVIEDIIASIIE